MRVDRVHSDLPPRSSLSDSTEALTPTVPERNRTFARPPSSMDKQSDSIYALPVVIQARERNMIAPTEVRLVLKDSKEYNKLIKQ